MAGLLYSRWGEGGVQFCTCQADSSGTGMKNMGDVIGSLVLFVAGTGAIIGAIRLHVGSPTEPQPGFFPFLGGISLIVFSSIIFLQGWLGYSKGKASSGEIRRPAMLVGVLIALVGVLDTLGYVIGAYSVKNTVFDVGTMVGFGVMGYLMRKGGFPPAPLILAMILGPILERSLQQSLISSGGSPMIFIDKPISAALLAIGALLIMTPVFRWLRSKGR